jgi:acetyltransferase-like isoleucine patch superfamily enzyme
MGERWIEIGAETMIGAHVSLAAGVPGEIGLSDGAVITIGDRCNIGRGSSIVGRCRIGIEDDVTTGPNVYITDHNHAYEDIGVPIGVQWPPLEAPVRIGAGSWLAAGVTVLPGADIGRHVTVAAGAVVRGKVPDYSVVAGVPARVVRQYDAVSEQWKSER